MSGRPLRLLPVASLLLASACTRPETSAPDAAVFAEPEGELASTRPAAVAGRLPGSLPAPLLVTASGAARAPGEAVDGDLSTHWSQYGRGSWLQADLGAPRRLRAVDVAWFRGDRRYNHFTVSVSSDGAAFTPVYTGSSSGRTLAPERYAFGRPVDGRFLRVTVEGNSENDWVSIDELAVETEPTPAPAG